MDLRERIKRTNTYKRLGNVQQVFMVDKSNIKKIQLGLEMSRLRGYEYWEKITHPTSIIKIVVKELLNR